MDIVIEGGRIVAIEKVGLPRKLSADARRPAKGDREIDCRGKYVTPGFVHCHAHIGIPSHALPGPMEPADYGYKLWMAHRVTTVRAMRSERRRAGERGGGQGRTWVRTQN